MYSEKANPPLTFPRLFSTEYVGPESIFYLEPTVKMVPLILLNTITTTDFTNNSSVVHTTVDLQQSLKSNTQIKAQFR